MIAPDGGGQPKTEALRARLGKSAPLWVDAIDLARERSPALAEAWHFAGPGVGWTLRLVDGGRILVYLTPGKGRFRVGMVLGRKAVAAARLAGLSQAAAKIIDAAPAYAEGHGVRFEVASGADMRPLQELLAIKVPGPAKPPRRRGRS
ncbi:MAG TPA: DUF3788 family protein [Thermoanaerobaculia bacterium]